MDNDSHVPEPDPSPEEVNSMPTLQETIKSIFGSEDSAVSEFEDTQDEEDFPSPPSDEEIGQNVSEAKASQSWAERTDEENIKSPVKTHCPRCRVDSHSEEECTNAFFKEVNNRKLTDTENSKQGKSNSSTKRRRTFKRFILGCDQGKAN